MERGQSASGTRKRAPEDRTGQEPENPSGIHFSHRVDVSGPNPIIALQRSMKSRGIGLRQLNDSNPTHHGLTLSTLPERYDAEPRGQHDARAALARFLTERRARHGYDSEEPAATALAGVPEGAPDADEKVTGPQSSLPAASDSSADGASVDPDDLYLASSTSEAYSWLMKLLCDPGEAVLCSTPGYPLIDSIARLEGVTAITYPLHFDGSWVIDVPEIERLLEASLSSNAATRRNAAHSAFDEKDETKRESEEQEHIPPIRALILISPNNPTGSYVLRSDYERLIRLCQRYHLPIIVDEVFYDFLLDPLERPFRISGESRVLTFGLDGFSKLLAAPHAKVGWIRLSGPREDVEAAKRRLDTISDDFLPMSGIIAQRIPELLGDVPGQVERISERTRTNLTTLRDLLARHESGVVTLLRPEGGWNILLRFPSSVDESELVDTMIRTWHMTGQPGYFFDMPTNGYMCVSLLPEPDEFRRNVTDLLEAVDSLLG